MDGNDNNNNSKNLQGFVPFYEETAELTEIEKIDQENKIKLVNTLSTYGGLYKYSIILSNESSAAITEIKTKVKFPNFLHFTRYFPPTSKIEYFEVNNDIDQLNLELDELEGDSVNEINIFFFPNFSRKKIGEIVTNITFVNNEDYIRMLSSENIEITIDHVIIEKTLIAPSHLQDFSKDPEIEKAKRSFGIGIEGNLDYVKYFEVLKQIASFHHFQHIFEDEENLISWYFGTETESKEQVLLIAQVVKRKLEFIVATKNSQILLPILIELSSDLRRRLLLTNLIITEDQIYEMDCKYCGSILPFFPEKGKAVECTSCHSEQIIW